MRFVGRTFLSITVTDSAITGNHGAGITGSRTFLTVAGSTVSENDGFGLSATKLTLTDSTVSGNTASRGGGIFLEPTGTAVLTGTNTFFNNVPNDCVGVSGC